MKSLRYLVLVVFCSFLATSAVAQDKKDDKEKEIPKPKRLTLKTSDNVNLVCNYFGGTKEKESVPIILLHDLEGQKEEFNAFALYLQKVYGHAVIVPDLRGHGESTKTVTNQAIDISKFKKNDYATFNEDISTCFRYLRDEVNNKGECNIDMLCVLASGYVSINAMAWTLEDYSYAPIGNKKQGQFVKGVVLLNPRKSIKGFTVNNILKNPLFSGKGISPIPVLIAAGDGDDKSYRDAKSIYNTLKRTRPKYDDIADTTERYKKLSIWLGEFSKSAGTEMLNPQKKTKLEVFIARFIQFKILANSNEIPWVDYKKEE